MYFLTQFHFFHIFFFYFCENRSKIKVYGFECQSIGNLITSSTRYDILISILFRKMIAKIPSFFGSKNIIFFLQKSVKNLCFQVSMPIDCDLYYEFDKVWYLNLYFYCFTHNTKFVGWKIWILVFGNNLPKLYYEVREVLSIVLANKLDFFLKTMKIVVFLKLASINLLLLLYFLKKQKLVCHLTFSLLLNKNPYTDVND